MTKIRLLLMMVFAWLALVGRADTITDTIFNRAEHEEDFAFGADVSFVPQMESWGTKWLDKNGKQKDILQILKEQGINNIRLRVWTVNSGASSKGEVVAMCKRAKQRGMGVMIDFHYSDTWADPGSQTIPSAWTDHSVEALSKNVYDHTYDVLKAIKDAGVVPKWVQVGNETKRGMLYPVGQTNQGGSVAFAKFVQSGYDAVKAVDSTMQVIVHLPDGHDNSLYRSIFDGLRKNGATWDIIGLSAYPRWSHLDGPTMINRVMNNINDLKKRYNTPCMIVETGHYPSEAIEGNQYLVGVMARMLANGDLGCFYWEPESMGGYDMGAWDESTRMPTVMMDAFLGVKHTTVSWVMRASMLSPTQDQTVTAEDLKLSAKVTHIRKRTQSVTFTMDKRKKGVATEEPYEIPIEEAEIGVHTACAMATDTDGRTQATDTVTFYVGDNALMDSAELNNADQKGATMRWGVTLSSAGKYRFVFKYSAPQFRGSTLSLNGDSITRAYFPKNTDAFLEKDIEVKEAGAYELMLTATNNNGLPEIEWLRIFPLEGQSAPTPSDVNGIVNMQADGDEMVGIYSLSGILLDTMPLSQLGISLGDKEAAVVVLPDSRRASQSARNCVGATPNIVRKLRLK